MNFKQFKHKYENVPIVEYPNEVSTDVTVSICVQTYQHAGYISKCLDSILEQKTTFNYEILLGEDASTDGTREICIDYANKFPDKIKLFLHSRENNIKINGNPTGRFNFLYNIFSANGRFIAVCEGDDYWTDKNKLQKQVKFLDKNPGYNVVAHNISTLHDTGKLDKARYFTFKDGRYFLYKNFAPTLSVLFRKTDKLSNLPNYIENTSMADFPILYHVADSKKVKKMARVMGVRRIHVGGVWSQLDNKKILEKGIEARKLMRNEVTNDDMKFLNAGLNRLEIKKFILDKNNNPDVQKPVLLKNAKYEKFHTIILKLSAKTNNKSILHALNLACDLLIDFNLIISR